MLLWEPVLQERTGEACLSLVAHVPGQGSGFCMDSQLKGEILLGEKVFCMTQGTLIIAIVNSCILKFGPSNYID